MKPSIQSLEASTFVGKQLEMSFAANKTRALWMDFMPRRRLVEKVVGTALYSFECYPEGFHKVFNPHALFVKWAAVKVAATDSIPVNMEVLNVPAGEYAVFQYKGKASDASSFYESIYTKWLPATGYTLDERPHFTVMGERYKNEDPESEEEIWIPIRLKA